MNKFMAANKSDWHRHGDNDKH